MNVSFKAIDSHNFEECISLSAGDDGRFVAPNVYSIAQAKVEPMWEIRAVYADDAMVGFVMFSCNQRVGELYLCRFMIDKKYHGKGYGRAALDLLKEVATHEKGIERMKLSTAKGNARGIRLYERYGFVDANEMDGGEEVFVLELAKT